MSSSKGTSKDLNLLQMFNSGRPDHRVVTRSDLTTNYLGNDNNDNDNNPRPSNSDDIVAINNYYTWNSSKTISSIHKERAEIISALHSVKSAAELFRGLETCDGFTRSHRIKEIVSMCADRRRDFSADEYHRQDRGNSGNERVAAAATEPDDDAVTAWPTSGAAARRRSWSSSYLGGASRCWSCTATDRETDDDDDDDDDDDAAAAADEAHNRCRKSHNRRLPSIRKFGKGRDSR